MLNRNIGLRDICHSITGGALVAQGMLLYLTCTLHPADNRRLLDPLRSSQSHRHHLLLEHPLRPHPCLRHRLHRHVHPT